MSERSEIEKLWREEKYAVMLHSQKHYIIIRETLKRDSSLSEVERLIADAKAHLPTQGSVLNACQHMWGYFKKQATPEEKARFADLQQAYQNGEVEREKLLHFIKHLAEKYQVTYLINSTILQPYT
ncbi:hypothetical protein JNUCC1_00642 [Lentibacillus sp. JNUCC-1]|uniref:YbgA family protein n=1 Tax=Lentibacillus sp. JNUCC-1 TaxID=2654513 RepID=UPI0012E70235|nr:YbgA family protein [Lentibacillus sp. JNUCC-1]MUV36838.1 hypothetical protein [Lentibacillus sp. JNUCC-1]